jgi:hypothetical protein
VNAIPSDLGVAPAGGQGLARDKDVANTMAPADGHWASRPGFGALLDLLGARSAGTRSAKTAARGALDARPAQGRVGVILRHHAQPHAPHRLLSAPASARPDLPVDPAAALAVRPARPGRTGTARSTSRSPARTMPVAPSPDTMPSRTDEPARPATACATARGRGSSRGKGVCPA